MQCEEVKLFLSVGRNGPPSEALTGMAQTHLEGCTECTQHARLVARVEAWSDAWKREDLTIELPLPTSPQRASGKTPWFALASACAALAIVTLLATQGSRAEAALPGMARALASVKSAHWNTWWRTGEYQTGPLTHEEEDWWEPGKWRKSASPENGGDRLILKSGGNLTYFHYSAKAHRVVSMPEVGVQINSFGVRAFGIPMLPANTSVSEKDNGIVTLLGRPCKMVDLVDAPGGQQVRFWIDPATNLPVQLDKQVLESGRWTTVGRVRFDFNHPVPGRAFQPSNLAPSSIHH